MKLIDGNELWVEIYRLEHKRRWKNRTNIAFRECLKVIQFFPKVDAEPVRHGHWYDEPDYMGTGRVMYFCSYCGSASYREDPYCWHCGSKMDVSDTDVGKKDETCNKLASNLHQTCN